MKLAPMLKPSHWISPPRARQLQRAYNNLKLTLVCGLLTIVVLRGTLGAGTGNFGTPAKDFEEIRHRFEKVQLSIHIRKHASRVLAESAAEEEQEPQQMPSKVVKPRSHYKMDIASSLEATTMLETSFTHAPTSSPHRSAEAQSQIRRAQLTQPKVRLDNKPRTKIMLVTPGSQPSACGNPDCEHCLLKTIKNKVDYCRIHGIEIVYSVAHTDKEMSGLSTKLSLLRKLMLLHQQVDWFWWIDSDTMFTDMAFELPLEKYQDYNMVLHGWNDRAFEHKDWVGIINTGSFLMRNSQWSLDMLDAWAGKGAVGAPDGAGKVSADRLTGEPERKVDDEAALMYPVINERAKWGDKVLLESSYYLHGYLKFVMDKYEGVMEKALPGVGDEKCAFRWMQAMQQ